MYGIFRTSIYSIYDGTNGSAHSLRLTLVGKTRIKFLSPRIKPDQKLPGACEFRINYRSLNGKRCRQNFKNPKSNKNFAGSHAEIVCSYVSRRNRCHLNGCHLNSPIFAETWNQLTAKRMLWTESTADKRFWIFFVRLFLFVFFY